MVWKLCRGIGLAAVTFLVVAAGSGAGTFCYSDYVVTAGFNNSTSHGGPIMAGLPVRIAYYKGEILRIDVRQDF
jgi:hypothetical protein